MTIPRSNIESWAGQLLKVIDNQDAKRFSEYFTEDGLFVFGSFPEARGRGAISGFVEYFFSSLKSLNHELLQVNQAGGLTYIHFNVTYELKDGRKITIPGLETLNFDGDLVEKYIIYMDPTKLLEMQAAD